MKEKIQEIIKNVILSLQKENVWDDFNVPNIEVKRTGENDFGDYTTNVAFVLAKKIGKDPNEIAKIIAKKILDLGFTEMNGVFKGDNGYINYIIKDSYFQNLIGEINKKNKEFGNSQIGKGRKINNEFISANPTGPLHLGNGRGGFYGDSLGKVLKKCGYDVTNEYYVNDAGEQILKLGHSVLKDSEAVYQGEYIDKLNEKYAGEKDIRLVSEKAIQEVLEDIIQPTVKDDMKIEFDFWISEKKDLVEKGYVEKAIKSLKNKSLTFEKDDALWLRTTDFGDDKDRVLVKSDGQKTYFASDCGYLLLKAEKKFDTIIEIWGADHHGYVNRFKAAALALEFQKEQVRFIIVQLVKLVKDGKEVRMSKRAGNVVYIDELIDEVGHDVARFFFLMYSPDTHMNFDLGLAKEKSQKNPVYYVQYAFARISSILEKSSVTKKQPAAKLDLLVHEKELSLIRELSKFTELVEELSQTYEVHKLPYYSLKLADKFHSFYNDCKVNDLENPALSSARLELVKAVKIVLGETLRLIGVSAPEKM